MKYKFLLFVAIISILVGFSNRNVQLTAGLSPSSKSVEILRSTPTSITIAFSPKNWISYTKTIDGEELTQFDFHGATSVEEEGYPQIPYHVAILGIPLGAEVRTRIVDSETQMQNNIKLLPYPGIKKVEGWPEFVYKLDDKIYSRSAAFPDNILRTNEPAFFRDQQIVRLQVAGARFLPDKKQLLKYDRIVVQVDFVDGQAASEQIKFIAKHEENLYKSVVLNYDQAKRWRKGRQKDFILNRTSNFQNSLYKFTIQEEGIYRIDGEFFQSNGLNLNTINPSKIRLFNNGGRELPRDIGSSRPDGLIENAIIVEDGGDGNFDSNDFILFYGVGVNGWDYNSGNQKFSHYINHYGFDNVYWLSFDGQQDGKRIVRRNSGQPTGNIQSEYQGLAFLEEELQNPVRSGLNWYGRQFAADEISSSQSFTFDLPNAISDQSTQFNFRFASKSSGLHLFSIFMNDNFVGDAQLTGSGLARGSYLILRSRDFGFNVTNVLMPGSNSLQLSYSPSLSSGQALLDWVEILYRAQLNSTEDELAFTIVPTSASSSYRVDGFSTNAVEIFDVTDHANVGKIINGTISNGALTFTDSHQPNVPKRYLATTASNYKSIQTLERVEVTDLRSPTLGAEFIIITHDDFVPEALRLESLRENGNPNNQLVTEVVRISDIYNNFSGGLFDATAIRDFLKFAYDNWNPQPAYVFLLGDGDYDYKNIINRDDLNWIPTFQTDDLEGSNSIEELVSRTSDSWFTYVSGNDTEMDLAIGRMPVQTLVEARNVIDKIIAYETQPLRGTWRNTITMVGDDELITGGRASSVDAVHIVQTEIVAEAHVPKSFDLKKIYLPEFPKVLSASVSGVTKPAAREALINQINEGTLIVNFIGHGNSQVWAHEVVFHQTDNDRVQNSDKLIFFVAATCDWALHDNPQRQSQAEELLLMENRGAIAILSSARLVFSDTNFRFNKFYYDNLFNPTGETNRIGDAFMAARCLNGATINDEKYHIYGDPTLRLAVPRHEAVITSMDPDSIVALTTLDVAGEVHIDGQFRSDFNGTAFVNAFDSRKFVRNIPEAGSVQNYFLPGNSIYRGSVPVQNGRFSARFIVPKDISYGGRQARISAYFWNEETDGTGFVDNIVVSSTTSNLVDTKGPEIRMFFTGHENFTTGDIIEESTTLVAEIADTVSGINIAGEIGHRITLSIDPNQETCLSQLNQFQGISTIDLTDLFTFNEGDHLRGRIEFPLNFPSEVDIGGQTVQCTGPDGDDRHTLVLKVWDNSNNSSTASVEVLVVHEEGLVLREVMNYPNPLQDKTTFTFFANQDVTVQIKIFTVSGRLIRTLEYTFARNGFNMVDWDGLDDAGDRPANGVYLYKLIAKSQGISESLQKEVIGRLAVIR